MAHAASIKSQSVDDDDKELEALGYVPSFKREFSNLATISFAFSIMGLCSSIATTFNTPLLVGGPSSKTFLGINDVKCLYAGRWDTVDTTLASMWTFHPLCIHCVQLYTYVVWCWFIGSCMCFTLGASIAEIVSAFPTCGGLYSASALLVPKKHRARVGYVVGWLNILGQIAGVSSTEFGLANMIWAAVQVAKPDYVVTSGKTVGLFTGLLIIHGLLNSLNTRYLARFTSGMVFVNLGTTGIIIIVLLATTPRSEMHPAGYVFGSAGVANQTGGWPTGLAFLMGLLSVQWTMTDYDATAHISEEVRRAAFAAPVAIFVAVIGTGILGWLLNIVLILCSGPLESLQGVSTLSGSAFLQLEPGDADVFQGESAFYDTKETMLNILTLITKLQIMANRMGEPGALFLWAFVCLTAFFVCQTALQAVSRTVFAFSRDHGLPDNDYLSYNSRWTQTPLRAIWFSTLISIVPGLLDLASPIAAQAIFALTAMALDLSYIIPILCRRIYRNHPEVNFKPGPFYLGDGLLGWTFNINCILWTFFVFVIFSMPTVLPVTKTNMNYASVITVGVIVIAGLWYMISAHRHYKGPVSNLPKGGQISDKEKMRQEDVQEV